MGGNPAQALEIFDRAYDRGADPGMVLQDLLDILYTVTRLKTVRGLRRATICRSWTATAAANWPNQLLRFRRSAAPGRCC